MTEAEKHDDISFRAILLTVGGVLSVALIGATLETVEQVLLVGEAAVRDERAEILAIHFELLLAAFGIIYSAETVAPTGLAGPLAHAYRWLIIAGVFCYGCVFLVGVLLPQSISDICIVYWLLRVVLPDVAAIVILVRAALAAQLVERGVRKHVDLSQGTSAH